MVRRALIEPITALAGGIPQVSLARFEAWISSSRVERGPSHRFGGWDVEAIVEAGGGGCEKTG